MPLHDFAAYLFLAAASGALTVLAWQWCARWWRERSERLPYAVVRAVRDARVRWEQPEHN